MKRRFRSSGLFGRVRSRSGYVTFSETADQSRNGDPLPRFAWACDLAQPVAGRRIADVGCWTGGFLEMLAPLGPAELVGIDVAGPWLSAAEMMAPSARFFGVANLAELPTELDRRFNIVTLLETLEHLPRGSEYLSIRSLATLLAPSGTLIISTPAAGLAALLDPAWFLVGHRHYRQHTLAKFLFSAEMEIQHVHYSGNIWSSLDTIMQYTAKHLLHRSYSAPTMIASRIPAKLYSRRRWDSANIWIEARLQNDRAQITGLRN